MAGTGRESWTGDQGAGGVSSCRRPSLSSPPQVASGQADHPSGAGRAGFHAGRLPHLPWTATGSDPPGRAGQGRGPAAAAVAWACGGRGLGRARQGAGKNCTSHRTPDPRRLFLHLSFLSPVFILWLWTKPIARDLLQQAPFGGTTVSLCVRAGGGGPPCPSVMCMPKCQVHQEVQAGALGPRVCGRPMHRRARTQPRPASPVPRAQAVGRGLRLAAPVGAGGAVRAAPGGDPAAPAGLPLPGQGPRGAAAAGGRPHRGPRGPAAGRSRGGPG